MAAPDPPPEDDPDRGDGSPNFWLDAGHPVPADDVAELAVRTLRDVFALDGPNDLVYQAWESDVGKILLPTLSVRPDVPDDHAVNSPDADRADGSLTDQVDAAVLALLDIDEVERGGDGDIPIRVGTAWCSCGCAKRPNGSCCCAPCSRTSSGTRACTRP